ncbi:MAG: hypothetical protein CMP76_02940 [Flavobacterium sp.]|uniref:DUF6348 family protein n=1 Tax=Flavobacterium sp. TaxID=239 RepID=UPI000C37DB4D|nr:DUF6348 family protein [Flavobacterium sp.]MBF02233.1 hypothetical protein [Flavobacterium sp.]
MKFFLQLLILFFLGSCKPNSEKKIILNNIMDVNKEIKQLFEQHRHQVTLDKNLVLPHFKEKVTIDSKVNFFQFPNGVNSKLDIIINFQDGRKVIESFGDIGTTKEEAVKNNLKNFVINDFHVITSALNDSFDDEVTTEEWNINDKIYQAYIGNFGRKGNLEIPENTFNKIEEIVKKQDFNEKYHWIRFYYGKINQEPAIIEFLVDNKKNHQAEEIISKLDWQDTNEYASVRNFIILKKK